MKKLAIASLALLSLTACAKKPSDPNDPLEPYNRAVFAFNMDADHLIIRPVTKVYSVIVPPPLQQGITNFFDNTLEITTFPNDLLQGNFKFMAVDVCRFMINTTLGIGGLFDVATRMGLPKHFEGFGLTLAKWRGGKSAPYFVIPLLGPSTIQSAIGLAADIYMSPWPYINNNYIAWGLPILGVINYRASLLPADKLVDTSFDPYSFVRDAYMQRQAQKIAQNQAQGDNPMYKQSEFEPENTIGAR